MSPGERRAVQVLIVLSFALGLVAGMIAMIMIGRP